MSAVDLMSRDRKVEIAMKLIKEFGIDFFTEDGELIEKQFDKFMRTMENIIEVR